MSVVINSAEFGLKMPLIKSKKNHYGHLFASLRGSKTRLIELVSIANSGEEILITVHGQLKASLLPVSKPHSDTEDWLRELSELRSSLVQPLKDQKTSALDEVREDRWCKPLYCDTSCVLALYVLERISSQVSELASAWKRGLSISAPRRSLPEFSKLSILFLRTLGGIHIATALKLVSPRVGHRRQEKWMARQIYLL